jgi:hypothetical protein
MGKGPPRLRDFNWVSMVFPPMDLEDLGESFSEFEVLAAIKSMPSDKAPGLDGFTGAFYKACWQTIKHDVMRVVTSRKKGFHSPPLVPKLFDPRLKGVRRVKLDKCPR